MKCAKRKKLLRMPKSVKRFLDEMRAKKSHAKKCEAVFALV
jgi:hypothetical protein